MRVNVRFLNWNPFGEPHRILKEYAFQQQLCGLANLSKPVRAVWQPKPTSELSSLFDYALAAGSSVRSNRPLRHRNVFVQASGCFQKAQALLNDSRWAVLRVAISL